MDRNTGTANCFVPIRAADDTAGSLGMVKYGSSEYRF
jgi:hypothetical protein